MWSNIIFWQTYKATQRHQAAQITVNCSNSRSTCISLGDPIFPMEGPGSTALLPMLQEIVSHVRYGPEDDFAAFVQARQMAGSPVRVVSGPKNRLTLF